MAKKKAKGKRKVKVDFSGATTRKVIPEGTEVLINPVELELKDGEKAQYISWKYEVTEGKYKGQELYNNTSLAENSLWNLRGVLEAHGIEVPEKKTDLDLDKILKEAEPAGAVIDNDTYQGKKKSVIGDIFDPEALEGNDGEDDGEEGGDDDDDTPDEDAINEMDEDELEEVVEEHDLEINLDDAKGKGKKKLAAQRKMVIEALEEEGDDGDGDDDDTYTKDAIMDMKSKELKEVAEKHDLDVDFTGKVKKDRKAVIEALEEEELLEEDED